MKWIVALLLAAIVGGIVLSILGKGDATLMTAGIGLITVGGAGVAKVVQGYVDTARQEALLANYRADRAHDKAAVAVGRAVRAEQLAEQSSTQVGQLLTELSKEPKGQG